MVFLENRRTKRGLFFILGLAMTFYAPGLFYWVVE